MDSAKPPVTWGAFLDNAPDFDVLLFPIEDFAEWLEREHDPLRRAIGFFNGFAGEVENGGLAQYFFNAMDDAAIDEAPAAIRQHPLLQDVADLVDEAFARPELGAADVNSPAHNEFNERAWPINEAARKRILFDIVSRPHAYLDIAPLPGVTGEGVEHAEAPGAHGAWRARFVEGFPIGPNIKEGDGVSVVRFSATRAHLEFDRPSGAGEPDRCWLDFTTGLGGRRQFHDGKLSLLSAELDSQANYRFSERFDGQGRSTNSELVIRGVSLRMANRYLPQAPFQIRRFARRGVNFQRSYFANGQVNAELVDEADEIRYTASFDENGRDLAPQGSGKLRMIVRASEEGEQWREAALVDGRVDGRLVEYNADGSVAYEQLWRRGKLVNE